MSVEPHIMVMIVALGLVTAVLVARYFQQRSRRILSQTLVRDLEESSSSPVSRQGSRANSGASTDRRLSEFEEGIRGRRSFLVVGFLGGGVLWIIFGQWSVVRAVALMGGGYFLGYALAAAGERRRARRRQRELEFFLPLVMERLVMAVHAGLDVVAAIRAVLEHERFGGSRLSPVSVLLEQVLAHTEAGLTFEDALQIVGSRVSCPAIRHAFLHLGTAYREGGELVMPLRELSDATQLYYQESLEEEVARMPVRATVPLVVTFAGLIMIFVAMPLVQVMTMMKRSMPTEVPHVVK